MNDDTYSFYPGELARVIGGSALVGVIIGIVLGPVYSAVVGGVR